MAAANDKPPRPLTPLWPFDAPPLTGQALADLNRELRDAAEARLRDSVRARLTDADFKRWLAKEQASRRPGKQGVRNLDERNARIIGLVEMLRDKHPDAWDAKQQTIFEHAARMLAAGGAPVVLRWMTIRDIYHRQYEALWGTFLPRRECIDRYIADRDKK